MEELKAYVLDEQRVVTYKWLSSTVSISADSAKRMLYQFVDENPNLNLRITYLISGLQVSEGALKKQRVFKLVSHKDLECAVKEYESINSTHIFSVAIDPRSSTASDSPEAASTSAESLWAADHTVCEEFYKADPAQSNCLRDNRYGRIKCSKAIRDLKPRQLFPMSPSSTADKPSPKDKGLNQQPIAAKNSSADRARPGSAADANVSPSAEKPSKLSAAEQRMRDLSSTGGKALPEKKMSAAEMRMKQLTEGKAGTAKPAASAFFSGRGATKSSAKKGGSSRSDSKNQDKAAPPLHTDTRLNFSKSMQMTECGQEDEEEEEEPAPAPKAKPILEFQFEFEKSGSKSKDDKPQDVAKKQGRSERASSGKEKGQKDGFINDDSESGEEEDEEEVPVALSKQTATRGNRKGRRRLAAALDSDSEEELFAKKPETVKPDRSMTEKYQAALAEESSDAGKTSDGAEEDSGEESDSSHASQHTDASEQEKSSKKKGDVDAVPADAPSGQLVVTLKAGAEKKKGRRVEKDAEEEEAEEGGDKKRRRRKNAKNADEEGKEKEGESKSKGKRRRKRAEDGGEEGESKEKTKKERKREATLDMGQKTLDLTKFAVKAEAPSGGGKRMRKIMVTRKNEKGYFVTEEVMQPVSDDEPASGQADPDDAAEPAAEPSHPGTAKQDKPAAAPLRAADKKSAAEKKPAADKKPAAAPPPKAQAGIASFFKKQPPAAPP